MTSSLAVVVVVVLSSTKKVRYTQPLNLLEGSLTLGSIEFVCLGMWILNGRLLESPAMRDL